MESINSDLTEFSKYDINYVNQLIDLYNTLDDKIIKKIENNLIDKIGNISLLPDDIVDLKLIEFSKLRNYYNMPPGINISNYYASDYSGNKIYFLQKLSGPNYDQVRLDNKTYEQIKAESDSDSCECDIKNFIEPTINSNRNIFSGIYENKEKIPVTIEWLEPKYVKNIMDTPILDEMAFLDDVISKGVDTYFVKLDYNFWGLPVLIKEQLLPLDLNDFKPKNVYTLGIKILNTFKSLHTFGILNDLSIDNIGKNLKGEYHILNYSNMANTELYYGYRRTYWNNLWSSQVTETEQVTTAVNDLLELGYLLNYMLNVNEFGSQIPELKTTVKEIDEIRTPVIHKYITEIKKTSSLEKNYDILIKILEKGRIENIR